ncbi:MAG: hypothetical protein C4313_09575 [Thermoflexus sp.]|uniref:DUF6754 domain-containing protein n=1 Tax=Thermoflexus sp. TaxID=1969742 RepID=UPI00332001CC
MTAWALLVLFALLTAMAHLLARRIAARPRGMAPFQQIPRALGRSLETGEPLHLGLGAGGLVGSEAALTWSGVRLLDRLADEAAAGEVSPQVTVADPLLWLYAFHRMQEAVRRQGLPPADLPERLLWMGASPMAYAAGLLLRIGTQPATALLLGGVFRAEALLAGERGSRAGMSVLSAMPDPLGAAALWPLDPTLAVGEEAFAAPPPEATAGRPLTALLAHDLLRWLLVVLLLGAAVGLSLQGR